MKLRFFLFFTMLLTYVPATAAGELSINFRNVDIGLVVESVSKLTGRNFILDPRVNGRVTLLASTPVNEEDLYEVLLNILHVYGFAAIPGTDITKIVPAAIARSYAPAYTEKERHALITEVIKVVNNSSQQLVAVLRPMLSQNAHLVALANGNSLVVSDVKVNVERIKKIITKIDTVQKRDYDIIQLNHASAEHVMALVQSIYKNNNETLALNLQIDTRTNRLILSASKDLRLAARALIAELDTPLDSGSNVRVLYLKFAKAENLVPVIESLLNSDSFKSIATTNASAGDPLAAALQPKGATKPSVVAIQQASTIQSLSNGNPSALLNTTSVTADTDLNALIISGPSSIIGSLEAVIRKLDIPRAQVSIEVIIAELSDNQLNELGLDWIANTNIKAIGDLSGNLTSALTAATQTGGVAALAALAQGKGMVTGIGSGSLTDGWAMLISAIDSDGTSNVLSTPYIITLDNEEANFVAGEDVPFVTGSSTTSAGASTSPFQTISRKQLGIKLKVKPQITGGDTIKLEISQEVSSVVPNSINASDLVTSVRQIETVVQVNDNGVIALGGLQQNRQLETTNSIPILSSIPLLGALFRYQNSEMRKTTLMLFLRPRILKNDSDLSAMSYAKYHHFRSQQMEYNKNRSFIDYNERPLLPELRSLPMVLDLGLNKQESVTFVKRLDFLGTDAAKQVFSQSQQQRSALQQSLDEDGSFDDIIPKEPLIKSMMGETEKKR